jgi:hypothetical protein
VGEVTSSNLVVPTIYFPLSFSMIYSLNPFVMFELAVAGDYAETLLPPGDGVENWPVVHF